MEAETAAAPAAAGAASSAAAGGAAASGGGGGPPPAPAIRPEDGDLIKIEGFLRYFAENEAEFFEDKRYKPIRR